MKLTLIIPVLTLSLLLMACHHDIKPSDTNSFNGLWKLHIMEQKDSVTGNWQEWREGMQGYILYDDQDHMAVHLTVRGYENTAMRFPNFVDTIPLEALKHLTKSYVYFAKYTVDEANGTVEHARISHSNPADWNVKVKRKYTFKGDTLILEPVEQQNAGLRLKWVREP
jgi:hypothetical protein